MPALTKLMELFERGWTNLCRPLILLLNAVFRPDPATGAIRIWKMLVWIVVNCVVLALVLNVVDSRAKAGLTGLFLLLHILVILGSLRVMSEEKEVLEGSRAPDKMTFSVKDAVNNVSMLATSVVFYIFGLPALIGLIEDGGTRIFSRRPLLPLPYAANLACVLNEVPGVGAIMNTAANLSGLSENLNADIAYSGIAGNIVRLLIMATVGVVVVRAIVLRLQQASHRRAIMTSVEAQHGNAEHLLGRLLRVPNDLAARLHRHAAATGESSLRQHLEATLARLGHRPR